MGARWVRYIRAACFAVMSGPPPVDISVVSAANGTCVVRRGIQPALSVGRTRHVVWLMCRFLVEAVKPAELDGLEAYGMVEQLERIRATLVTIVQDQRTWRSPQIRAHAGGNVLMAACAFLFPWVPTVRMNDNNAVMFGAGGEIYAVQCYYPAGTSDVSVKATKFAFASQVEDVGGTADLVLLRLADIGSTPSDPFGGGNTYPSGKSPFVRSRLTAESSALPDGFTAEEKESGTIVSFKEAGTASPYRCVVPGENRLVTFCQHLRGAIGGRRLDGLEVFNAVRELAEVRTSVGNGSVHEEVTWGSEQLSSHCGEALTAAVVFFVLGGGRALALGPDTIAFCRDADHTFMVQCTGEGGNLSVSVRRMDRQRYVFNVGNMDDQEKGVLDDMMNDPDEPFEELNTWPPGMRALLRRVDAALAGVLAGRYSSKAR